MGMSPSGAAAKLVELENRIKELEATPTGQAIKADLKAIAAQAASLVKPVAVDMDALVAKAAAKVTVDIDALAEKVAAKLNPPPTQ